MTTISEDEFFSRYRPVKNSISTENDAWDNTFFDTYGAEREHVRSVAQENPLRVWTLLECESGDRIVPGMHFVNCVGYFITEVPAENKEIEVLL